MLGGDWKQPLPVDISEEAQFVASIKNTEYFDTTKPDHFRTTRLTINNRIEPDQDEFKNMVKLIGVAATNDLYGSVHIPPPLCTDNIQSAIDFVFDRQTLANPLNDDVAKNLKGCAILCPTNDEVFRVNDTIMVLHNENLYLVYMYTLRLKFHHLFGHIYLLMRHTKTMQRMY